VPEPDKLQSAAELLLHKGVAVAHCRQVANLCGQLFRATASLHGLGAEEEVLLLAAALLHDVGISVSYQGHHKHSQEIILHSGAAGFSPEELRVVACLARYHRKSHPSPDHSTFARLSPEHQHLVRKLAALLRIADGLDRTHCDAVAHLTAHAVGPREWEIRVSGHAPLWEELWAANDRKSALFSEVYGVKVSILRAEARALSPEEHPPGR